MAVSGSLSLISQARSLREVTFSVLFLAAVIALFKESIVLPAAAGPIKKEMKRHPARKNSFFIVLTPAGGATTALMLLSN
jgi:hypothetical protein